MSETTTALVVAGAAVGLFLLYESMQQQQAVQNAILLKLASQPTVVAPAAAPSSTFGVLTPFIGPLLSLL